MQAARPRPPRRGGPRRRAARGRQHHLQARFGLDDATVGPLRDLSVFYDRDEGWEFLHFSTETVGELYLEVLERRGGYRGFGAPDAPVRMAAQFALSRQASLSP
ncbi:hypothetical protein V6N00_01315 [Tersicoccus sp. MR15.9]